jgi:hypothetical protein
MIEHRSGNIPAKKPVSISDFGGHYVSATTSQIVWLHSSKTLFMKQLLDWIGPISSNLPTLRIDQKKNIEGPEEVLCLCQNK